MWDQITNSYFLVQQAIQCFSRGHQTPIWKHAGIIGWFICELAEFKEWLGILGVGRWVWLTKEIEIIFEEIEHSDYGEQCSIKGRTGSTQTGERISMQKWWWFYIARIWSIANSNE